MVLLNSEKISLGSPAPSFKLRSVDSKTYALDDFKDKKVLIVMFICAHCPYVVAVEDRIVQLRKDYEGKSIQLVGICANDPTDYPDDKPENLKKRAEQKGYGFPYLIDDTQEIAKAYGAVCTPEFYVYGPERTLAYHGRLDDNWKEPQNVKRRELREALDLLLDKKTPPPAQMPSMGCSIKWKK
jgi:peroxiredoxin